MLKIKDSSIVTSEDREVLLRGVNLGAWLMMEGYFLYGRNISERAFKMELKRHYGLAEVNDFTDSYRKNFIREVDFKNIAGMSFNCIRLPFNYRLLEDDKAPFKYKKEGVRILQDVINLCERHNIYCILDMHASSGSQNQDWHSDSDGKAGLWSSKVHMERFFRMWEFLADIFKDKSIIAGYDILNEPVIRSSQKMILRNFYMEAANRIRAIDKKHIIFLEGNLWAQVLEDIGEPFCDNLAYSVHFYHPLDFTFNFQKGLKYPGLIDGAYWDYKRVRNELERYHGYSAKWKAPLFIGEFGVNYRCPECYGELKWIDDVLRCFKEFKFHWTYWAYKAVANSVFPDGIYQYNQNPAWVNRQGPVYGWENFYTLWRRHKKEIIESWKTENFTKNTPLAEKLTKDFTCKS